RRGRSAIDPARTGGRSRMSLLLWGILPYAMVIILIGGLIWRYRYDQFGWTTRSSQLYESRLLRIGSPLFHFGILVVVIGHIAGLEDAEVEQRRRSEEHTSELQSRENLVC